MLVSAPPKNYLSFVTNCVWQPNNITSLRLVMPLYEPTFYRVITGGTIPSLIDISIDYCWDAIPLPTSLPPVILPCLQYLRICGNSYFSPLTAVSTWELPALQVLVCVSAYNCAEHGLIPALENLGKPLTRLALHGLYSMCYVIDLPSLCPNLEVFEVEIGPNSPITTCHCQIREIVFHSSRIPSKTGLEWRPFVRQHNFFRQAREGWPVLDKCTYTFWPPREERYFQADWIPEWQEELSGWLRVMEVKCVGWNGIDIADAQQIASLKVPFTLCNSLNLE